MHFSSKLVVNIQFSISNNHRKEPDCYVRNFGDALKPDVRHNKTSHFKINLTWEFYTFVINRGIVNINMISKYFTLLYPLKFVVLRYSKEDLNNLGKFLKTS